MANNELEHPAIDQLAATPEILRLLMAPVSDELAARAPAAGKWSLAEAIEHLSFAEGHIFRRRLDRVLEEEHAAVENWDEKSENTPGRYAGHDPEDSFAHWEEQREDAIELLRSLPEAALKRTGDHPLHGKFTLEHLLGQWVAHDLIHVRQIAGIVRDLVFVPAAGPLF